MLTKLPLLKKLTFCFQTQKCRSYQFRLSFIFGQDKLTSELNSIYLSNFSHHSIEEKQFRFFINVIQVYWNNFNYIQLISNLNGHRFRSIPFNSYIHIKFINSHFNCQILTVPNDKAVIFDLYLQSTQAIKFRLFSLV